MQELPGISGKGVEGSTIAGNEAAIALLRSFLTRLISGKRIEAVDDQNDGKELVEMDKDDEEEAG